MADWAAAQGDVMGCRNSKVLPEPPGDVHLDLVKKVSRAALSLSIVYFFPPTHSVNREASSTSCLKLQQSVYSSSVV